MNENTIEFWGRRKENERVVNIPFIHFLKCSIIFKFYKINVNSINKNEARPEKDEKDIGQYNVQICGVLWGQLLN